MEKRLHQSQETPISRDDACAEVDIVLLEADGLPDPHAAAAKETEERLVGKRTQRWA